MKIIKVTDKKIWNDYCTKNNCSFLQSWEWGKVQKLQDRKIWRLGLVDENNTLVSILLLIKYNLRLKKSYLFSPWASWVDLNLFTEKIKEISKQENIIFFRYEPIIHGKENELQNNNFVYTGSVEPQNTLVINLKKTEEELLHEMHSKTRYNIRLAQKKGVVIEKYSNPIPQEQFEDFWNLIKSTYTRKGIKSHTKEYYQNIFKQNIFNMYLAKFEGKTIVANLVVFFGDTATYLHGGSDKNFQKTMATSLIQWQTIKDAKEKRFKYYDFYGIASDDDKNNPWFGITRFKKGFGGTQKNYVGAWDLVLNKFWYFLYKKSRKVI